MTNFQYAVPCKARIFYREEINVNKLCSVICEYTFTSPVTNKEITQEYVLFPTDPVNFVEKLSNETWYQNLVGTHTVKKKIANAIAFHLKHELDTEAGGPVDTVDPIIMQQIIDRINSTVIDDFTLNIDLTKTEQDGL